LFSRIKFIWNCVVLNNENQFSEKTLFLKKKLIQREQILQNYQQQINQVDQQLLLFQNFIQEDSSSSSLHSLPSCYSSLYALELLWSPFLLYCDITFFFVLHFYGFYVWIEIFI
jgi:hypothetical protein